MTTPDARQQRRRDLIAHAEQVARAPLPPSGAPLPLIAGLAIVGTVSIGAGVKMVSSSAGSSATTVVGTTLTAPEASGSTTSPASSATAPVVVPPPTPTSVPPGTRVPVPGQPTRWVVFADGRFHLRGAVPDLATASAVEARVAMLLGPDRVVTEYVIDPTAPAATDDPVYVPNAALFSAGDSRLDDSAQSALRLVWGLLGARVTTTVEVHSHPSSPNLMLDAARTDMVRRWFAEAGVNPSRVAVTDPPRYGPDVVPATDNGVGITVHGVFP